MSRALEVAPLAPDRPFEAAVEVPGSKSITNRALACAALAEGSTLLRGALFSDDSRHMARCLRALGAAVEEDPGSGTMAVQGLGGPPRPPEGTRPDLFVGNAGTAARFLPCLFAAGSGTARFDGEPRMRERPMGPLIRALQGQGAAFSVPGSPDGEPRGYPFEMRAAGLRGGEVEVDLAASSQFASGLLMAAPYAASPLRLTAAGGRSQHPYVDMTAAVMGSFGVRVEVRPGRWAAPAGRGYRAPGVYDVEPDLSAAAYFFAAAALAPGRITVRGVTNASIQGDLRFLKVLQHLGVRFYQDGDGLTAERPHAGALKGGVTVDMNAFSDQALTLAVLAPLADAPIRIANVGHIRGQECDRLAAIAENLGGLGVDLTEGPDGVEIRPWAPADRRGGAVRTHGDHRVAMAFGLLGLAVPGIVVDDADCVGKTFPGYWTALESLREAQRRGA